MAKNNVSRSLFEFNNIFKKGDNIYREFARFFGLSECTLWILYCLRAEYSEMTQSGLCGSLCLPKQTINSALKKLETEGYIELSRSDGNRRSKEITLTAEGERLCEDTVDRLIEVENITLKSLPEAELEIFLKLFRKHTALLKNNVKELIWEKK
ncbi:MAG: winged helix DNA-binding protein [Butyrivibrio sp.]|nr:winged helix DNA-binding protein [Butyrivibrio sp.]